MKYIVTETKAEDNETHMWEYDTLDNAVDNIKHMKTIELQPYLGERTIRLFKAEEIDTSNIEGYTMQRINDMVKEKAPSE